KNDAPPRLESRGLRGARFLECPKKVFKDFLRNRKSKRFSCARESPRSEERGSPRTFGSWVPSRMQSILEVQDSRHNEKLQNISF
ncbi:MAG: hypothetical protein AABX07_04270, partial [Nanoarchaeota archaeon]